MKEIISSGKLIPHSLQILSCLKSGVSLFHNSIKFIPQQYQE